MKLPPRLAQIFISPSEAVAAAGIAIHFLNEAAGACLNKTIKTECFQLDKKMHKGLAYKLNTLMSM
jgi:hypothetical protein